MAISRSSRIAEKAFKSKVKVVKAKLERKGSALAQRGLKQQEQAEKTAIEKTKKGRLGLEQKPFQAQREVITEVKEELVGTTKFVAGELATTKGRKRAGKAIKSGLKTAFVTAPGATFSQAVVQPLSTKKGRAKVFVSVVGAKGISKVVPTPKAFKVSGKSGTKVTIKKFIAMDNKGNANIIVQTTTKKLGAFSRTVKKAPKISKTQKILVLKQKSVGKITGKSSIARTKVIGKKVRVTKRPTLVQKLKDGKITIKQAKKGFTEELKKLTPKERVLVKKGLKGLKKGEKILIDETTQIAVNLKKVKKLKPKKAKTLPKSKRTPLSKTFGKKKVKPKAKPKKLLKKPKKAKPTKTKPSPRIRGGKKRTKQVQEQIEFGGGLKAPKGVPAIGSVQPLGTGARAVRFAGVSIGVSGTKLARKAIAKAKKKPKAKTKPKAKPKAIAKTKPKAKPKPKRKPAPPISKLRRKVKTKAKAKARLKRRVRKVTKKTTVKPTAVRKKRKIAKKRKKTVKKVFKQGFTITFIGGKRRSTTKVFATKKQAIGFGAKASLKSKAKKGFKIKGIRKKPNSRFSGKVTTKGFRIKGNRYTEKR